MNITTIQDYYKLYDLPRNETAKVLHKMVMTKYKEYQNKQQATDSSMTEVLEVINKHLSILRNATRDLRNEANKEKYDKRLKKAYEKGLIKDEEVDKAKTILEKALDYFNKGKFELAVRYAREVIQYNEAEEQAYEILVNSYFIMNKYKEGMEICDKAISLFPNNLYFKLRTIRTDILYRNNIDSAQNKLNEILAIYPDDEVTNSEQIFVYLYSKELDLACAEIDKYIKNHTQCDTFRRRVANDLATFSLDYYTADPNNEDIKFIMNKRAYQECLKICKKAYEIQENSYTKSMLEEAQYYGKKQFNEDNKGRLFWMFVTGIVFLFLAPPAGILFLLLDSLLLYISFRPVWQLNRIYMTGWVGPFEACIIITICFCSVFLKFIVVATVALMGFGWHIAQGRWGIGTTASWTRQTWRLLAIGDDIRSASRSILSSHKGIKKVILMVVIYFVVLFVGFGIANEVGSFIRNWNKNGRDTTIIQQEELVEADDITKYEETIADNTRSVHKDSTEEIDIKSSEDIRTLENTETIADSEQDLSESIYFDVTEESIAFANLLQEIHDNPKTYVGIRDENDPLEVEGHEFAVEDIDQDGVKELIVRFNNTYGAAQYMGIWTYDTASKSVFLHGRCGIGCEFYEQGILKDVSLRAQSSGRTILPYTLSKFERKSEGFQFLGNGYCVDAEWDTSGTQYSSEKDLDSDGVIYYFVKFQEGPKPLTLEEYNRVTSEYIDESKKIELKWNKLTEKNIEILKESTDKTASSTKQSMVDYLTTIDEISYHVTSSGAELITCKNQSQTIKIPNFVDGVPVICIQTHAFDGCYNLQYIDIPEGVTEIGGYAFWDCQNIIYMVLPDSLENVVDWALNAPNITFICHEGTFGQQYSEKYKRPWIEGDSIP